MLQVGYSDHTEGIVVPIAAAALGACVIEKHFTLDKAAPGPDHKASMDPADLKRLVKSLRDVESSLGDGRNVLHLEALRAGRLDKNRARVWLEQLGDTGADQRIVVASVVIVKTVSSSSSWPVYLWDNSALPDEAAREKDKASRTATFTRALQNMKTLAEGGTLAPR